MRRLLIASHGRLASGMKSSLNVLIGECDQVTAIDAFCDELNFPAALKEYFESIPEDDQVIMMSDLYGGSINQMMYMYLCRNNTFLLSGVNLAIALELAVNQNDFTVEQLELLVEESRQTMKVVRLDESISQQKQKDFFD